MRQNFRPENALKRAKGERMPWGCACAPWAHEDGFGGANHVQSSWTWARRRKPCKCCTMQWLCADRAALPRISKSSWCSLLISASSCAKVAWSRCAARASIAWLSRSFGSVRASTGWSPPVQIHLRHTGCCELGARHQPLSAHQRRAHDRGAQALGRTGALLSCMIAAAHMGAHHPRLWHHPVSCLGRCRRSRRNGHPGIALAQLRVER